jgi:hypothetical protein
MPLAVPDEYAGLPLREPALSLLPVLERHSFSLVVTGKSRKTLRVFRDGANRGYINSTVITRGGVIGYHFDQPGHRSDACPPELKGKLVEFFCRHYACSASALDVQEGAGANRGKQYLLFKDPQVALRVLLQDSGVELEQDVHIATVNMTYVEGRLIDVVMQRRERSEDARSACLAAYGFSCYVCGVNLKARYSGLPMEIIHVHHEEPLSQAPGEREVDPVASMKPVCPNCHCVIHSRTPAYAIEDVKCMLGIGE